MQEAELVHYITFLEEKGSKAHLHKLKIAANKIFYNSSQDQVISIKFIFCFLKRHPDFFVQKQKPLLVAQKNAHNIDALLDCFHQYKKLRKKFNILDKNTWNFDESKFRLEVDWAQFIVTKDAHRKLIFQDPDNRKFLICIESISSAGKTTPLYLIFSGWQMLEKWFEVTNLDENTFLIPVTRGIQTMKSACNG